MLKVSATNLIINTAFVMICFTIYPPKKYPNADVHIYKNTDIIGSFNQKPSFCSDENFSSRYIPGCENDTFLEYTPMRTYTVKILKVELKDAGPYFCELVAPDYKKKSNNITLNTFSKYYYFLLFSGLNCHYLRDVHLMLWHCNNYIDNVHERQVPKFGHYILKKQEDVMGKKCFI